MCAQWLRIHGCHKIFLVDVDETKLALARDMGFVPVNAREIDPVEFIVRETGGGVRHSMEACGLPCTFTQALQVAGMFGQVVFMGNISGEFRIGEKDFSNILRKELVISGTWNSKITPAGSDDWSTVLKCLDRDLVVAPLITHKPRLAEGPTVFARIHGRQEFFNKVIFDVLAS